MEKKTTKNKNMKNIIETIERHSSYNVKVVIFEESVILNEPIENWPRVDSLLSFFSDGFPLDKAIEYYNMFKPDLVNDLEKQKVLLDREQTYSLLKKNKIESIPYEIIRKGQDFVEEEDYLVIGSNNRSIKRPFIEKPFNAEAHDINIYYPFSKSGGRTRLFRKKNDESSAFDSGNYKVRTDQDYIYQSYIQNDGFDYKIYAIGDEYTHCEARKSPTLDGVVLRTEDGYEVRYPVVLKKYEKKMAKKIYNIFRQFICGFDFIRDSKQGYSYVIDINGFSFVKNNKFYNEDLGRILSKYILDKLRPNLYKPIPSIYKTTYNKKEIIKREFEKQEKGEKEMKCIIGIMRHSERTPKQKIKIKIDSSSSLWVLVKDKKQVKIKSPDQMRQVRNLVAQYLEFLNEERFSMHLSDEEMNKIDNKINEYEVVHKVMMDYNFQGIDRKIQIKPNVKLDENGVAVVPSAIFILKWGGLLTTNGKQIATQLGDIFTDMYPTSSGGGIVRLHNTLRHDLKIFSSDEGRCLKTAAEFTKSLLNYKGDSIPLIYSMVHIEEILLDQTIAAEEDLKRIKKQINSFFVKNLDYKIGDEIELLENVSNNETLEHEEIFKNELGNFKDQMLNSLKEYSNGKYIGVPINQNFKLIYQTIVRYVKEMEKNRLPMSNDELLDLKFKSNSQESNRSHNPGSPRGKAENSVEKDENRLSKKTSLTYIWNNASLIIQRYKKLLKDIYKKDTFVPSNFADVYDNLQYDIHQKNFTKEQLEYIIPAYEACYVTSKLILIPLEYGCSIKDRFCVSICVLFPLILKLRKILENIIYYTGNNKNLKEDYIDDEDIKSPHRFVLTRLFFTSQTQMQCMLILIVEILIQYKHIDQSHTLTRAMFDVNFLCSIVFRVWEEQLENGQTNLTIEIMHSPGIRQLNVGTSYPDNMDDHGDYKDLEKLVEINVNEFLQMTDFDENHYIIKDNENAREFVKMCTSLNINKKTQKIHKDKEVRNTYEKYTEQNVKMLKKILQTDEKMSPEKDKKRNRSSSLSKEKREHINTRDENDYVKKDNGHLSDGDHDQVKDLEEEYC